MPFAKPRTRTPALLAANRLNARKYTGPRTPQGEARVALNALKHGRYAVACAIRSISTGDQAADQHFRCLRSEIGHTFQPQDTDARRHVEQLADQLCAWGGGILEQSR